jgi:hypothetical protein
MKTMTAVLVGLWLNVAPGFVLAQITPQIVEAAKKEGDAESQRLFGGFGEYVFHPEADHKFKQDVKDDQIVVMRLPSNEELENWSKKFREMFR